MNPTFATIVISAHGTLNNTVDNTERIKYRRVLSPRITGLILIRNILVSFFKFLQK
jgi:hypothetical protein